MNRLKILNFLTMANVEIWRDIEGYEGLYQVSNLGRVKSLERKVSKENTLKTIKERIKKQTTKKDGYKNIMLHKEGIRKTFRVHRLVAIAFIPNPLNKETVNHKDENPSNNLLTNLEWMTNYENCRYGSHDKRVGEALMGEKNYRARKIRCLETGEVFDCIKYACEWCGLKSSASISECCQGKRKSAGKHPITKEKLHWMYVEQEEVEIDLNIIIDSNINIKI